MALTVCPKCLKGVPDGAPRCPQCGEPTPSYGTRPLSERLLCQRCFKPVPSYAVPCASCGGDPKPKPAAAVAPTASPGAGIFVLTVFVSLLAWIFWPDSPEEQAEKARRATADALRRRRYDAEFQAVQIIEASARDPESVKTRNLVTVMKDSTWVVCGEYNAKNGFGGYVGFRGFAVSSKGDVATVDQNTGAYVLMRQVCAR